MLIVSYSVAKIRKISDTKRTKCPKKNKQLCNRLHSCLFSFYFSLIMVTDKAPKMSKTPATTIMSL